MDAVLRDIVETFESALGPFADPEVMRLAQALPETLERPAELRVLMQGHRRAGVRARPALITVVAGQLAIAVPDGSVDQWPLADCTLQTQKPRIGGARVTIAVPGQTVLLQDAMPVDEVPRLVEAVMGDSRPGTHPGYGTAGLDGEHPLSAHPPVARLGSVAILYDDRIAFADAPTRMLNGEVRARALELPTRTSTTLRSVSRLMQGARGRPRQVLIDGPGWTELASAPETDPGLADAFADAINRWAASSAGPPNDGEGA